MRIPFRLLTACLLCGSFLLSSPGRAQDTVWTRRFDTGQYDYASGGARDGSGELTVTGWSSDQPITWGAMALTVKYGPDGDTVWSRVYDSDYDDVPEGVAVDAEGNVVVVGWFCADGFTGSEVLKYDPNGGLLWARLDSSDANPELAGVVVDDSMNIIACGMAELHLHDVLLVKYSPSGESLWARTFDFGGRPHQEFIVVKLDHTGNIVCAGVAGDYSSHDVLTAKFGPGGEFIWSSRLDFGADETGGSVAIDAANNIIVAGSAGQPDGSRAGLAVKYTPGGDTVWSRLYRLDDVVWLGGLALDRAGNILMTGTTVDTGSGQRRYRCLVMMCDSMGDTVWTWRYDPGSNTFGCNLALDDSGHIYVFGRATDADDDYLLVKLRYESGIQDRAAAHWPGGSSICLGSSVVRRGSLLRLRLPGDGQHEVALFDALGQKARLARSTRAGPGMLDFGLGQLRAGVYVLRVTTGGRTESQRLVLVE